VEQFNSNGSTNTQRLVFSDVFSPSSKVINEFRAGYNRMLANIPINPPAAPGTADVFGNYNVFDLSLNIGPAVNSTARKVHVYQFSDNVSVSSGRHTMKFGAELRNVIASSDFLARAPASTHGSPWMILSATDSCRYESWTGLGGPQIARPTRVCPGQL
jgi:hypothetical protein